MYAALSQCPLFTTSLLSLFLLPFTQSPFLPLYHLFISLSLCFLFQAYKLARGKVWPLISLLCFFSAFVSAFLVRAQPPICINILIIIIVDSDVFLKLLTYLYWFCTFSYYPIYLITNCDMDWSFPDLLLSFVPQLKMLLICLASMYLLCWIMQKEITEQGWSNKLSITIFSVKWIWMLKRITVLHSQSIFKLRNTKRLFLWEQKCLLHKKWVITGHLNSHTFTYIQLHVLSFLYWFYNVHAPTFS